MHWNYWGKLERAPHKQYLMYIIIIIIMIYLSSAHTLSHTYNYYSLALMHALWTGILCSQKCTAYVDICMNLAKFESQTDKCTCVLVWKLSNTKWDLNLEHMHILFNNFARFMQTAGHLRCSVQQLQYRSMSIVSVSTFLIEQWVVEGQTTPHPDLLNLSWMRKQRKLFINHISMRNGLIRKIIMANKGLTKTVIICDLIYAESPELREARLRDCLDAETPEQKEARLSTPDARPLRCLNRVKPGYSKPQLPWCHHCQKRSCKLPSCQESCTLVVGG